MDVVQFGRWLAERRRACGWRSQRALVSASLADPHARDAEITAAFLARLEAGLLAYPFRGSVRKRVLALTWLLCKSPRQVRAFVQHAGITDLDRGESAELDEVCRSLASPPPAPVVIVPPRPVPFLGRESATREVLRALVEDGDLCLVISGMPGIGKSALAAEVAHMVARTETGSGGRFADGVITIACEGRRGIQGLVAVLEDVLLLAAARGEGHLRSRRQQSPLLAAASAGSQEHGQESESDAQEEAHRSILPAVLAGVTARVRAALAGKRLLVVLDNVDGRLPLNRAVQVLATAAPAAGGDQQDAPGVSVLATTRYMPRLSLAASRIHPGPLAVDEAVALFEALLGRTLAPEERALALEACEAVGRVPLAIAALAAAASLGVVPLSVITTRAQAHPLDLELDGGLPLRALYAEALDALAPEAQDHYALLSLAEAPTLSFETVVALRRALDGEAHDAQAAAVGTLDDDEWSPWPEEAPERRDRSEAARAVEQLVRHSLLEVDRAGGATIRVANPSAALVDAGRARFRLPPLLRGYASERAARLDGRVLGRARQELSRYALAYVERANGNVEILREESELLHAAVAHARRAGDHAITAMLVHQVFPLFYHLDTCAEIERILRWGLEASQAQRTDRTTARFLNHLGIILYYRGDLGGARRAWEQGLALARCPLAGATLQNLSQLAEVEGDEDGAWQLADQAVLQSQRVDQPWALGNALLLRAQLARRAGDRDRAHKDVSSSLEAFASVTGMHKDVDVMAASAQAELARVERNYPRARQLVRQMLDAANQSARLVGIELALEQADFALDEGMMRDAHRLAQQASARAHEVGAYLLDRRAGLIMRRATEAREQLRRPS